MKFWRTSLLRIIMLLFTAMVGMLFLAQTTVAQSNGTWTNWLDRDNPSGTGDWEHKNGFNSSQVPCSNPTAIQARVVGNSTVYRPGDATPDTLHRFSASQGLVCRKADQADNTCNDYQVRFFCSALVLECDHLGHKVICTLEGAGQVSANDWGFSGFSPNYTAIGNSIHFPDPGCGFYTVNVTWGGEFRYQHSYDWNGWDLHCG